MSEDLKNAIQTEFDECGCNGPDEAFVALKKIGARRIAENPGDATPIIDWIMDIYDAYVAPFDIPVIPNVVEPAVDRLLGQALRGLLEAVAARLNKGD